MKPRTRLTSPRDQIGSRSTTLSALQTTNLAAAFLLELCALAALGYWGFHTGDGLLAKLAIGIGAPLLAAIVWGLFVAPQATVPLGQPWHVLIEALVFGCAAVALYAAGQPTLAWLFVLAVVLNHALLYVWRQ